MSISMSTDKKPKEDTLVPERPSISPAASGASIARSSGQHVNFSTVLHLMTDPATANHFQRQAAQLTAALQQCRAGLTAKVANDGVPQIFSCLCRTMQDQNKAAECLEDPFAALLKLCGQPIECTTLNDQRLHADALSGVMVGVAEALDVPQEVLRVTAATVLRQIFSSIRALCYDDLNQNPNVTFHKKKDLQRSITDFVVVALLRAWERTADKELHLVMGDAQLSTVPADDEDTDGEEAAAAQPGRKGHQTYEMIIICKAVLELTNYRRLSTVLLSAGVRDVLFSTLRFCSAGDQRVPLAIEMIWNVLELIPAAAVEIGTCSNLGVLHSILLDALSMGYKLQQRELRNDIIVVLGLIAKDAATHSNFSLDLIELLFSLSCGAELGKSHPMINLVYHGTTQPEELQMKLEVWNVLYLLCSDPAIASSVFDWGFFDVLLSYVNVNSQVPAVVAWSTLQVLDIQEHVFHLLHNLMAKGSTWFEKCHGPATLKLYIEHCPKVTLRNQAVAVLAMAAATDIRGSVESVGSIPLAIQLLGEGSDLNVLINCLNLLSDVVQREPKLQKQFDEHGGVAAVLPLLSLGPDEYTDLLDDAIFAVVNCVWQCVYGNASTVDHFVSLGGIGSLLGVLERSPKWMISLPLSCLADLIQFESAAAQCRQWRSSTTGMSCVQIALSLWKMDDAQRNENDSANDVTGLLTVGAKTHRPLPLDANNDDSSTDKTDPQPQNTASDSFSDESILSASLRRRISQTPQDIRHIVESQAINLKVFAVMAVLGFQGHKELDAMERAALEAVANLVALCKDEVWENIEETLAVANIEPIAADHHVLQQQRDAARNRSIRLQAVRQAYLEIHRQRSEESERTFYRSLIKKTEERTSSSTKPLGLSITEAKIRKAQMLKASFKQAVGAGKNGLGSGLSTPVSDVGVSEFSKREASAVAAPASEPAETNPQRWDPGQRAMRDEEYKILQVLNEVRTKPTSFVPLIEEKLKYLDETGSIFYVPGFDPETCVEGPKAYTEAINFLKNVRPLVTLLDVPVGLVYAARDHVTDLRGRMDVSQDGFDKSTPLTRIKRYGTPGRFAQLTALGHQDPTQIVMQLVVDDGVSSRVDRNSIFDPDARLCGLSVGPHSIHGTVAVIILAHEFTELPLSQQDVAHANVLNALSQRK